VLTGQERLGKKWMDEQRIDNCKVPIDKRGTKSRPSICNHVSMGTLRPGTENLHV
jgi:ribosomal protein L27